MDNLRDLLAGRERQEPPEMAAIKRYVAEKFDERVGVTVREREIIIACPSAALAGTLRLKMLELQALVGSDKRLVFRVGQ